MRPTRPIDPEMARALIASDRWRSKVDIQEDGCHLWVAAQNGAGYGRISLGGRGSIVSAHRVALVAQLGRDLEAGMEVGHQCHDAAYAAGLCLASTAAEPCVHRQCVNPLHLAEQTTRANLLSAGGTVTARHAVATHCKAGHPLSGEGADLVTAPSVVARGWRHCATCGRDRTRVRDAAISEARNLLGMSRVEYIAEYGTSRARAEQVIAAQKATR